MAACEQPSLPACRLRFQISQALMLSNFDALCSSYAQAFVRDHNGKTALHLADEGGHLDAAAILRAKTKGNAGGDDGHYDEDIYQRLRYRVFACSL
jgi:ankyrin repeat protein